MNVAIQVGNGGVDHSKMMRPEEMNSTNMPRPAYKVTLPGGGSDLAGSMVAAFAAGSKAFKMSGKYLISNSICEFTNSSLVDTMY